MKKLFLTLVLASCSTGLFAQGTVTFANTTATKISTNATAIGGTRGPTAPAPGWIFFYALFAAPFGTANSDLSSGQWTFTGLYATNTGIFGRLSGGSGVATVAGWPGGVTNSFQIAGWSSNLGHDWTSISNQLLGAQLVGSQWTGGHWASNGFFGQSGVSFGEAGGGAFALPPFPLFGAVPTQQGTPLTNGFDLYSVVTGPSIIGQPTNQTVIQGASATFAVSAISSSSLTYQWQMNGNTIPNATGSSLTIASAQPSDAGSYVVLVTDANGSTLSSSATLTVLVPPSITQPPQSQTVLAGTNVTLTVAATGTPTLIYQWSVNSNNIAGATSSSLAFTNIQLTDSGNYSVAITNSAGYAISDPAVLTVVSPPVITNQPQGTVGYWGKSASFTVAASGTAPFSYFWYKDGVLIVGATNATLSLTDLELTNSGNYTVVVSNAFGTVTSSAAYLTVNPAGISLGMYPGVTIDGTVGKTYGIQYTTNVVQSGSWTTITNVTLTEPVFLWIDTNVNVSLGNQPQRSYRVVAVP